ncbi:MAG: Arc/MetJ-type ribon-helix-helix transcriptional regulator, partial [Myxococcota bacterium]
MIKRLLLAWTLLCMALSAAVLGPDASSAVPSPSEGPAPHRALPEDVSRTDLVTGERVSVTDLLVAIQQEVAPLIHEPTVRQDLAALARSHGIPDDDEVLAEYLAVRTALEATRSGGWWHVAWRITDQEPDSTHIWADWAQWSGGPTAGASAWAECDEISALFAVVARSLGAGRVGLFWPTFDHTVAVWQPGRSLQRLVVPTTPIRLSARQGLGTREMDPSTQRTIYTYDKRDGIDGVTLPGGLARFFQVQVRRYAAASAEVNGALRELRERAYGEGWTLARVHTAADGLAVGVQEEADREAIER